VGSSEHLRIVKDVGFQKAPGAMTIPANIAEGRRQTSEKEFRRFLTIALNSSSELEYHLILAHDTNTIPEGEFISLITQTITVRKMLYALLKRLATPEGKSPAKGVVAQQGAQPPAAPPTAPGR